MDLSVIIVNWNTKDMLLDCVASLLNDNNRYQMEIIVIDNGSTDGSGGELQKQFPQVKLISNKTNLGFAKANNIGIEQSKGKYICLVNTDVIVRGDCFEKMCSYMDQELSVGMLGPKLLWPDLSLQLSCRRFPTLWNNFCSAVGLTKLFPCVRFFCDEHMRYFEHDVICDVDALVGAFLLVRKDAVEQVGMLDESFFFYGEEIDWCKRFHGAGWRVVFFPRSQVIHYLAGTSSGQPANFKNNLVLSSYKYWQKHHGRVRQFCFLVITLLRHVVRIIYEAGVYILKPSQRGEIEPMLKSRLEVVAILLNISHKKPGFTI